MISMRISSLNHVVVGSCDSERSAEAGCTVNIEENKQVEEVSSISQECPHFPFILRTSCHRSYR